jgi:hypothetical protein
MRTVKEYINEKLIIKKNLNSEQNNFFEEMFNILSKSPDNYYSIESEIRDCCAKYESDFMVGGESFLSELFVTENYVACYFESIGPAILMNMSLARGLYKKNKAADLVIRFYDYEYMSQLSKQKNNFKFGTPENYNKWINNLEKEYNLKRLVKDLNQDTYKQIVIGYKK